MAGMFPGVSPAAYFGLDRQTATAAGALAGTGNPSIHEREQNKVVAASSLREEEGFPIFSCPFCPGAEEKPRPGPLRVVPIAGTV